MEQAEQKSGEVEAARGEVERFKQEKDGLARELEAGAALIAELKQSLTDRDNEITILKQTIVEADKKLGESSSARAQAVAGYKGLVIKGNPEVPVELVTGDTIEAIDKSLENARALVGKVKQGIESEIAKAKVPFGAPPRAPIDLSALTAREKIQYGIGGGRESNK